MSSLMRDQDPVEHICTHVFMCAHVQVQACVGEKQMFITRTQSWSFIPSPRFGHVGKLRPREEKALAELRLNPELVGVRKGAQSPASL